MLVLYVTESVGLVTSPRGTEPPFLQILTVFQVLVFQVFTQASAEPIRRKRVASSTVKTAVLQKTRKKSGGKGTRAALL